MQNDTELIRIIEEAVSAVNTLSPINLSGAEELQKILDKISQTIAGSDDSTNQLLRQVVETSSKAAHLLREILNEQVENTDKSIKSVLQAVSDLQMLINQISQESSEEEDIFIPEEDLSLVSDFIGESNEHLESAEAALLELETKPNDNELLNQIFRSFHSIKGLAGFLNLTDIGSLAHAAESLLDLFRKGKLVLAGNNTDVVFESIDVMKGMINALKSSVEAGQAVPREVNLPQLLAKLKTHSEGGGTLEEDAEELLVLKEKIPAKRTENPLQEDSRGVVDRGANTTEQKVKVSTSRLDNLINMAGELVIAQLMVSEELKTGLSPEHSLACKVTRQGKIVRELQELSMSMRMVTIQGVFQKMARLVRDLSHEANKNIDFVTIGEETELDRSIVDKIVDPLVHMVRNSIDHGIESLAERKKMNKNPEGRIELRAFHQAGNIVIEIEDDGKGLNKDGILKKAIENGLVKAGQQLSDQEIFQLIFCAGFSTAQKITNVSGRGVGMDVVKKNIESLHGKININSAPGKGTTFTIRLPLTLAIINGIVVKVGNERYIIPIGSILGIIRPAPEHFSSVQNRGQMVIVRGQVIHMIRLYKLFGVVPKTEDLAESLMVLVEEGGKKCCLLIDELIGHQQVVIKSLGKGLGELKGVSGGAIMGDGKVSLILDIPGLIELARK